VIAPTNAHDISIIVEQADGVKTASSGGGGRYGLAAFAVARGTGKLWRAEALRIAVDEP